MINKVPTPIPGIHDQETVPSDAYVDMELGLPRVKYDSLIHAIVKRRKLDDDGNPIGTESTNPLVDTRAYVIEFIDGATEIITANTIAENLLVQVDEEEHRQLLLDKIIDYRRNNDAVHKSCLCPSSSTCPSKFSAIMLAVSVSVVPSINSIS